MVNSERTSKDKYVPSPAEQKLLLVLLNPDFYGQTVTSICREAGVVRDVYYKAFKKPGFLAIYYGLLREMVHGLVGNVIKAAYKFAVNNNKNNADRRMLLEMAGVYVPRQIKQHAGPDGGPIQFATGRVADLTDEELEQLLVLERVD